jgi:hypothetical protein
LGDGGDGLAGLCRLLNDGLTADHFAAHWFGMAVQRPSELNPNGKTDPGTLHHQYADEPA